MYENSKEDEVGRKLDLWTVEIWNMLLDVLVIELSSATFGVERKNIILKQIQEHFGDDLSWQLLWLSTKYSSQTVKLTKGWKTLIFYVQISSFNFKIL